MRLNLVISSYLNSYNLKVIHSLAYSIIKYIHQLLLKNTLYCNHATNFLTGDLLQISTYSSKIELTRVIN